MTKVRLEFRIDGEGIVPASLGLRDLVHFLDNLEQAIGRATLQVVGAATSAELALTEITLGSVGCVFTGNENHAIGVRYLESILISNDPQAPISIRRNLRNIWRMADANEWKVSLPISEQYKLGGATIDPQHEVFRPTTVSGTTTLLATIFRASGKPKPTAQIVLPDGQNSIVYLASEQMAASLAEKLYQTVSIEGEAAWDVSDWTLDSFRATRLGPYNEQTANPALALELLAKMSGGAWDHVDPEAYVRALRED